MGLQQYIVDEVRDPQKPTLCQRTTTLSYWQNLMSSDQSFYFSTLMASIKSGTGFLGALLWSSYLKWSFFTKVMNILQFV